MKFSRHILLTLFLTFVMSGEAQLAAQTPQGETAQGETSPEKSIPGKKAPARSKPDISSAVGITELKIEMAETRLKLSPSTATLIDLISPLEEYLNTTCMSKLPQNLVYQGPPTDPTCVGRMQRILEINPNNPVGICARDGIFAQSCINAYRNQTLTPFRGRKKDGEVDPALKIGLSATETASIQKLEESLAKINEKYRAAATDDEKRSLMQDAGSLYEQGLAIACKATSLSLRAPENSSEPSEPEEIAQARERLLQVPAGIRRDYQREMEEKAQKEYSNPTTTKERKELLAKLMKVIENPTMTPTQQTITSPRTRLVLPKCAELIKQASEALPESPTPICYREGWYSPQCIIALRTWRTKKLQEESIAKGTPAAKIATPSIISAF